MRCRTIFYTALGRLLNLDLSDDDDNFEQFMTPLSSTLSSSFSLCLLFLFYFNYLNKIN